MIRSVRLTNFFSFRDETIAFNEQVNLLVGINGSGKTNLLKAIQLLKAGVEGNATDNALLELITQQWGGFGNIYCQSTAPSDFKNSIGLEFHLNAQVLNQYHDSKPVFRDDIIYTIRLIRKPAIDNYYLSEEIATESGYSYLNFINGSGKVRERQAEANGIPFVSYDNYDPQELALSKISEFDKDRYLPLVIIKRAIKDLAVYNYFDTTPRSKLRSGMSATAKERKLRFDGSNLPQMLNTIKISNKPQFRLIQSKLRDVNAFFSEIDFNMLGGGQFELMLGEGQLRSSVHVTHISDGTLRYLCMLAIFYNPQRGKLICIDEPEVGLHPDMIFNIAAAIKEAAAASTMLIATHSEQLLNHFKVEDVLVFEKAEDNTTTVRRFSESEFEGWYEHFSPGQMWREGDLGGTRW